MKRIIMMLLLALAGCEPKPIPEPSTPPLAVVIPPKPPKIIAPVAVPSDPVAAVSVLPATQLPHAAQKSLTDADHYVAWNMARADNIDVLTVLTERVSNSIAAMKAGRAQGRYRPTDVMAARAALRELREFLIHKGD